MNIFEDYQSFKEEHKELLNLLIRNKSKAIARISPVMIVVDYLYDEHKLRKLNEDEELFFSRGFDYFCDQLTTINTIYEFKLNKDFNKLNEIALTINLLLYINDFQAEILDLEGFDTTSLLKPLDELEDKVNVFIDKGENAPEEYFVILNETVDNIFEKNDIEVHLIEEIFNEIAMEYDLYNDNNIDIYNMAFNEQIDKNRK